MYIKVVLQRLWPSHHSVWKLYFRDFVLQDVQTLTVTTFSIKVVLQNFVLKDVQTLTVTTFSIKVVLQRLSSSRCTDFDCHNIQYQSYTLETWFFKMCRLWPSQHSPPKYSNQIYILFLLVIEYSRVNTFLLIFFSFKCTLPHLNKIWFDLIWYEIWIQNCQSISYTNVTKEWLMGF